ncbi:hypothetical protein Afer_1482 [Acidimicrobium ferrooxidans DSM 10331]|uniref:Uncharacterized protein n=1 Tax=Acidimicrobium ferrooxidans (strain DSM 10331 / JCM 15462 / NBRC 103882 / ICP) TaxID=525909 RepID=C7M097_ACIFD|nr:hypothetical protein [Acidimicrobium ferrooxidans]ACU54405.1 hypothetical protein Afer_1482 [Acidimicrobium ferrooxidans DSM 10331]
MTPTGALVVAAVVGVVVIVVGMLLVFRADPTDPKLEEPIKAASVTVGQVKVAWYQTFGSPSIDIRLAIAAVVGVVFGLLHYLILAIAGGVAAWIFVDTYVTPTFAQRQIERLRDLQTFAASLASTATSGGNVSLVSIVRMALAANPENLFVRSRQRIYEAIFDATDPEDHERNIEQLIATADDPPSRVIDQVVILTAGSRIVSVAPLVQDLLEAITPQLTTFEMAYRTYIVPNITVARILLGFGILTSLGAGAYYASVYQHHLFASLLMQLAFGILLVITIVVVGFSRRPFALSTWFV